jgi:hypothetical protein
MSPEERQLLSDLFDRVRSQANAPRDRDAETFITDAVRAQPYAPYLLSQAVIVQEQALRAADQKIQALEAQVSQLQAQSSAAPQGGGFLGGLFGGGSRQAAPPQHEPGPWGGSPQQPSQYPPQYAPPPQPQGGPSPWGAPQQQPPQGGGFLRNALGAAAGVAGGVMLADSIRGLFGGGHGSSLFGGGANAAGLGDLGKLGGGETVVNNYFDKPQDKKEDASLQDQASDQDYTGLSDEDFGGDDDYSGDYGDDI